jgi:hypothetical protein
MSVKVKAKQSGFPFPDERQLQRERRGLPPLKLKARDCFQRGLKLLIRDLVCAELEEKFGPGAGDTPAKKI